MKKSAIAMGLMVLLNCFHLQAKNQSCCMNAYDPALQDSFRAISPKGPQGVQGEARPQDPYCFPCDAFLNAYSVLDQTVLPGCAVLMEGTNARSDSFDITMTPNNGEIVFNKSGIYEINWSVEGKLTPPFPIHMLSYSFGLTLDNMLIPGSVFGAFTISPNDFLTATGNSVIIAVARGQTLRLVNTSIHSVDLISIAAGSSVPNTSASVGIALKADL